MFGERDFDPGKPRYSLLDFTGVLSKTLRLFLTYTNYIHLVVVGHFHECLLHSKFGGREAESMPETEIRAPTYRLCLCV